MESERATGPEHATVPERATSPVVGVVVLLGVVGLLVASVGTAVTALDRPTAATPRVTVAASVVAADGYPDGQTVRLRHEGGDPIDVSRLAVVVTVPDGRRARASGFPTLRLTAAHRSGADLFDRSYAGVDGELDASTSDGTWSPGERLEVRLARGRVDLRPGERVGVTVVRRPDDVLARLRPRVRAGTRGHDKS
ncbi:MAG: type IV pilin [Haloarculaceae archaeon]